jgi:hypothetical protein
MFAAATLCLEFLPFVLFFFSAPAQSQADGSRPTQPPQPIEPSLLCARVCSFRLSPFRFAFACCFFRSQ